MSRRPVIYFTRELPGLSNDIEAAGFQVYEALSLSEVLFLAEQHPTARVVMDQTVDEETAGEVGRHHLTLRLTPEATAADVLFELQQSPGASIQ